MILSVCPNPSVDKYIELADIKAGGINRSTGEKYYPGGKGVHVSLAVNELGIESSLAGVWGGPTGQWVKQECSEKGVKCFGPTIDGWTRTCVTVNSAGKFDQTEILEQGPTFTEQSLSEFVTTIPELMKTTKLLSVSGSWPKGTPGNIYQILKNHCEEHHQLWIDASGDWLKLAIHERPYGIHVNLSEAQSLFGIEKSPAGCALELLNYCTVAAVTNGADGLYLASKGKIYHATCRISKVISTVGSGDCLLAGLLVAQYQEYNLREMAILGTACGTANCIRKDLGMLYKEDAERLTKQVICRKIS